MSIQGRVKTSPHRLRQAASTRRRVVTAARAVFARQGYAGARIEDIASEAGVSIPTVYKAFANKRNLLTEALTAAMTGCEGHGVELQHWWLEQLDAPTAPDQLRLIARNARSINERAGALIEVVRAAATSDPEIHALWRKFNDDRLARSRSSARRLAGKGKLLMSVPDTARTLWTLTAPELYALQVGTAGLTPARYEGWLRNVLAAAILQP